MTTKTKPADTKLSYSSSNLIQGCEQKYWHYKINKTAKDPDVEESTEAFDIGKAFHEVLEMTLHTNISISENVSEACKKYKVKHKEALIEAMVFEYLLVHENSGLDVSICEIEVSDHRTIGYIDAIMKDHLGRWWIVDLKTAGRWDPTLLSRLALDPQLNLYSYFYKRIGAPLGLREEDFMGCRYRVTTKTTTKQKPKEEYDAYVRRLRKAIKSYDIEIPLSVMDIESTYERFSALHARSMELRKGEVPNKNMGYCLNYFKPCEYWSHCHGQTYTESQSKVRIFSSEDYVKNDNLLEEML